MTDVHQSRSRQQAHVEAVSEAPPSQAARASQCAEAIHADAGAAGVRDVQGQAHANDYAQAS